MASIIKSNTYADFNGREILTASNDGALTTQKTNYPMFSVRISADQTLTNTEVEKVDLDTVMYDTDNAFDTTNNRFVVPTGKGGKYFIIVRAQMTLNDQDNLQLRINKNGSLFSIGNVFAPVNSATLYAEHIDIVDCVEADYIEFFAYHNFGSDRDLILSSAAEPRTLMRGYRIGS